MNTTRKLNLGQDSIYCFDCQKAFVSKEEMDEDSKQDFFFINELTSAKMLEDVVSLCSGRLKKFGNYDFFKDIQVLTPTKKGLLRYKGTK